MSKSVILGLLNISFVLGFPKIYIPNDLNEIDVVGRVIEGSPASIKDYPYYANIGYCGASIISDRWLLTAAHCIDDKPRVAYVGGDSYSDSIKVPIESVYPHPEYNKPPSTYKPETYDEPYIYNNDIGLVYLSEPLNFTDIIQPIKLPKTWSSPQRPYLLVGRGADETGNYSKTIMKLSLKELSKGKCENSEYDPETLYNNFICATRDDPEKPDYEPSACYGDSGSGITQDNTVAGLVSFMPGASCKKVPFVFYTRVITYLPWITEITGLQ